MALLRSFLQYFFAMKSKASNKHNSQVNIQLINKE